MKETFKIGDKITVKEQYLNSPYEKRGAVYIVTDVTTEFVTFRGEKNVPLTRFHFKLKKVVDALEEQIRLAQSFVGKIIIAPDGGRYTIAYFKVFPKGYKDIHGDSYDYIQNVENDFAVILVTNGCSHLPVDRVKLDDTRTVELNSEYNAKVTTDTIEVGCQKFPISILDALNKAHEELTQ